MSTRQTVQGIAELKEQAKELSELLHAPINPDSFLQDGIDADLENKVTRFGLALGREVDYRAGFNRAVFEGKPSGSKEEMVSSLEQRLSQACRDIITEIRPVGGILTSTEFSREHELRKLQETVGNHYPSSWIEASEKSGPPAIKVSHERGHYCPKEAYDSDDIDETIAVFKSCLLTEHDAGSLHAKLIEDGDVTSSILAGHPFDNNGLSLQVLTHNIRIPFDRSKDLMGAAGVPVGKGWKYGYIIDELSGMDFSGKQWYRIQTRPGQYVSTLYVPPADEADSTSLYHHEFCHRIEDTLGEKDLRGRTVLHRLQEAFLRRRTMMQSGNREPLVNIGTPTFNFEKIELARPADFMTAYVGKEYITSYAREVLSVGAEAAFGNRFGSFHGLGGRGKEDLDHRGFLLGVFATA